MNEIYRVLRPTGRFVIGMRPAAMLRRLPFTRYGFVLYELAEVEALLTQAGFQQVHAAFCDDKGMDYICIIAERALS